MRISDWSSDVRSSDLGPLVADRTRRVAIGFGAGDHVFDALGCTGDFVRQPVTVRRFEQGQDADAALFHTRSRLDQAQSIVALSEVVIFADIGQHHPTEFLLNNRFHNVAQTVSVAPHSWHRPLLLLTLYS